MEGSPRTPEIFHPSVLAQSYAPTQSTLSIDGQCRPAPDPKTKAKGHSNVLPRYIFQAITYTIVGLGRKLEPKSYPNQLTIAAESLVEIEKLTKIVSHSPTNTPNHIAKGLFGLLLLHFISPALRIDFRALMTLSDITREGEFDEKGRRLKDPDKPKRKSLREVVKDLTRLHVLTEPIEVTYGNPRDARSTAVLDHVPKEGIICWAGQVLYLKNRPSGKIASVFALKMPDDPIVKWVEVQRVLPTELNASRMELCTTQIRSSLNLIEDLLKKNKITDPEVTKKIEELRHGPDMVKVRGLGYLLAATEKTPGVAEESSRR